MSARSSGRPVLRRWRRDQVYDVGHSHMAVNLYGDPPITTYSTLWASRTAKMPTRSHRARQRCLQGRIAHGKDAYKVASSTAKMRSASSGRGSVIFASLASCLGKAPVILFQEGRRRARYARPSASYPHSPGRRGLVDRRFRGCGGNRLAAARRCRPGNWGPMVHSGMGASPWQADSACPRLRRLRCVCALAPARACDRPVAFGAARLRGPSGGGLGQGRRASAASRAAAEDARIVQNAVHAKGVCF
jgi:hypothetical protein